MQSKVCEIDAYKQRLNNAFLTCSQGTVFQTDSYQTDVQHSSYVYFLTT